MKSLKDQLIAIGKVMNKAPDQPPKNYFRFGKYNGCLISTVVRRDPDYISWLLDQEWLDIGVREKIEQALGDK